MIAVKDFVCVLRCKGGINARDQFVYQGPKDCWLNFTLFNGSKKCKYGCLGDGHCVSVCPTQAIKMTKDFLPVIDPEKCDACGTCVKECPRGVLEILPRSQLIYLACKSLQRGDLVTELCTIGCTGCGICIEVCPYEGAIKIEDNLPIIDYEKCNSCGICFHKCPRNCFIDRAIARPYGIISLKCNGCGECIKVCQFEAIKGIPNQRHIITKEKCVGCGRCYEVCAIKAITMVGALGYADVA